MSFILLAITLAAIVFIRALIYYYVFHKYPGIVKYLGYYILTLVTGIFLFFPTCIFLGNKVCWDYDVATHRTVLLIASTILLLLCAWTWYKIMGDPKLEVSSGKPVATLIVVLTIIVGLIILVFGTSSYWAPLVGH